MPQKVWDGANWVDAPEPPPADGPVNTWVRGQPAADDEDFTDLAPRSFRKNVGGTEHHVTEAGTAAAKRFQNAQMSSYRMDDGKLVGASPTFFDSEPQLVADCTYRVGDGGVPDKAPVPLVLVRSWPDRVTAYFFDRIKEMSPSLTGRQTVEGLDRQIAKLQGLRDKLAAAGGDGPKAPPPAGTTV